MKKTITTLAICGLASLGAVTAADAGEPSCQDMFGSGWANHGEHVLTYVNGEAGAAGGAPAHLSARPDGPAPGASFCLDQSQSPGMHPADFDS
mgnify:CR=1 FL=1